MCLAVPGQVMAIEGEGIERMGRVSFGGVVKQVALAYTPEARVSDYVYVHVGFALSTVDEAEAAHVFAYLDEMGELAEIREPAAESASQRASERVFDPLADLSDVDTEYAVDMLEALALAECGDFHHAKEVMA